MAKNKEVKTEGERVEVHATISPPKMAVLPIKIIGTEPYVQNAFSEKARNMMMETQAAGSVGKKGKKREPKNFEECFEQAQHVSEAGWHGIPAGGFRAAMVSACRLVGFKMTHGKLGLFIEADGYDRVDGTGLVKITKGKPKRVEHPVRNQSGVADIRSRPMWAPGWEATVRIRFDLDMFVAQDVVNLFERVGAQVGIGEGRPDSKESVGMGWGLFRLQVNEQREVA